MNAHILVVEDEPAIGELIAVNLRHAGYTAVVAPDATTARQQIDATLPDLVLLDWMLPDTSGIDLARRLRADPRTRLLPIIMLTARAQEGDKLTGFEVGVDDYITKPFSPRELLARVKAMFRVTAGGEPVSLSPTEFRLLHYLMTQPDRVLSRARLLDAVWGDHVFIEERTVDVHIRRLRLALQPSGFERRVETVRGGGYRLLPT